MKGMYIVKEGRQKILESSSTKFAFKAKYKYKLNRF